MYPNMLGPTQGAFVQQLLNLKFIQVPFASEKKL